MLELGATKAKTGTTKTHNDSNRWNSNSRTTRKEPPWADSKNDDTEKRKGGRLLQTNTRSSVTRSALIEIPRCLI